MAYPIKSYADSAYGSVKQSHLTGTAGKITVGGTNASAAILDRMVCLSAMRFLAASAAVFVGGTAAGQPVLALQKQLAGTGSGTTFGTYAFTTHADGVKVNFTVTETAFASGDVLLVTVLAGTGASTPIVNLDVAWVETFA